MLALRNVFALGLALTVFAGCASSPYNEAVRNAALEARASCTNPMRDAAGARYQVLTMCQRIRGYFPPRCVETKVYCD